MTIMTIMTETNGLDHTRGPQEDSAYEEVLAARCECTKVADEPARDPSTKAWDVARARLVAYQSVVVRLSAKCTART